MSTIPEKYFLYAEDDPDDQFALKEMIAEIAPDFGVIICQQGLELIQFLESLRPGDILPCCIILDMNMPLWDGIRTLEEIRKKPGFAEIPVVMFTTSSAERDERRCLSLGANAFITKPIRREDMKLVAHKFSMYCQRALDEKAAG